MSMPNAELGFHDEMDQSASPTPNLWHMVQNRMHGRWRYALPSAVLAGISCAAIGFTIAPVKYVARGYVKVEPTVQHVLSQNPEVVPMYDAIVETQVQVLQLDDLLIRALGSDEAKAQSLNDAFPTLADLHKALTVKREKGTFVSLEVEADDPSPAYYMARLILEEYKKQVAPDAEYESKRAEIQGLIERQTIDLDSRKSERLSPSGVTNPYLSYADEVLKSTRRLTWEIVQTHVRALAEMGVLVSISEFSRNLPLLDSADDAALGADDDTQPEAGAGEVQAATWPEPTPLDLNRIEPMLAVYRRTLHSQQDILDRLLVNFNDKHYSVSRQRTRVDIAVNRLRSSEESARQLWFELLALGVPEVMGVVASVQPERQAQIEQEGRRLWREIELINEELQRRQVIDVEIERIEHRLARILESKVNLEYNERTFKQGRTSIRLPILPRTPKKTKKFQFAIAGFLGGCFLPLGLFLFIGHVDRRAFGSRQVLSERYSYECIGVIPDLTRLEPTPETRELATACIHRIRNRIALAQGNDGHAVIAVTSPFQGDGKTSLAFALAWSYASSGYRTVLVDTDFIGQTLTAQIGRINQLGFRDLLKARKLNGEASMLADSHELHVIGVGRDVTVGPERVTRSDLIHLLEQLREKFEIAIFDTGPLLGSVETLPIASAVDGVLLTLRRGRPLRRLDECARELNHVGARLLGVVLNCADRSECMNYSSVSRVSARSVPRDPSDGSAATDQSNGATLMKLLKQSQSAAEAVSEPSPDEEIS